VLGYDVEFPGQPWDPHHPPALQDRSGFRSAEAAAHWATEQLRHERRRVLIAQLSENEGATGRADCRRRESGMSGSMVNFITIIVRRFGATSVKSC
jgi:hypothetical protein